MAGFGQSAHRVLVQKTLEAPLGLWDSLFLVLRFSLCQTGAFWVAGIFEDRSLLFRCSKILSLTTTESFDFSLEERFWGEADLVPRQDRMRGNMKFIGHLFLRQLLSAKVIGSVICASAIGRKVDSWSFSWWEQMNPLGLLTELRVARICGEDFLPCLG